MGVDDRDDDDSGFGNRDRKGTGPQSLKSKLQQFSRGVSATGVRYVFDDNVSIYRRIMWGSLVVFGLAYSIYQISKSIYVYAQRPLAFSIELRYADELEFPTVTFCNENFVKKSAIPEDGFDNYTSVIRTIVTGRFLPQENMSSSYSALDSIDVDVLQHIMQTGMYQQADVLREVHFSLTFSRMYSLPVIVGNADENL